jgi:hypothetical protein
MSGRAYADQEMHMCSNHSDLENPRSLLGGHAAEKKAQKPGETRVDGRCAVAGSPDDVLVHAIDHGENLVDFAPPP